MSRAESGLGGTSRAPRVSIIQHECPQLRSIHQPTVGSGPPSGEGNGGMNISGDAGVRV